MNMIQEEQGEEEEDKRKEKMMKCYDPDHVKLNKMITKNRF